MLILKIYSSILRQLTPNSGLTKLAFNRVTNALFKNVPSEQITTTIENIPIKTRIDDYHGRILWLFGSNDFKVSRVSKHFAKSCGVFLDIGANYSTIGLSVAKQSASQCKVHLFEPQPYLVRYVTEAIEQGGLTQQVHMHSIALLDEEGVFQMAIPSHHSGLATLVMEERFGDDVKTIDVPTVVTEHYIAPLVGEAPFGVKIDIEGAEKRVLPGLMSQKDMRFCLFEGANTDPEIFDIFTNAGFMIFGLCRTVMSVKIQPLFQQKDYDDFHDLIAIRTKRTEWPETPLSLDKVSQLLEGY